MSADGTFVPHPSWPTIVELAIELWGQPNKALSSHDDVRFGANGSKSVKPSAFIWKDHESGDGGGYVELWRLARRGAPLPPRETAQPKPKPGNGSNGHGGKVPPWRNVGTTYPYHDADGTLVLEVVRTITGTPRFLQRQPNGVQPDDGAIKWRWSVRDIPPAQRPLYRLPQLLASGNLATVFMVEGEKDADNLAALGLVATTSIGGAGKWRHEYATNLRNRAVVILPDNDEPGIAHAETVARSLSGVAASVRVLMLPGLLLKGDVSDWLASGGTRDELEYHARETPLYTPSAPVQPPQTDREDGLPEPDPGPEAEPAAAAIEVEAAPEPEPAQGEPPAAAEPFGPPRVGEFAATMDELAFARVVPDWAKQMGITAGALSKARNAAKAATKAAVKAARDAEKAVKDEAEKATKAAEAAKKAHERAAEKAAKAEAEAREKEAKERERVEKRAEVERKKKARPAFVADDDDGLGGWTPPPPDTLPEIIVAPGERHLVADAGLAAMAAARVPFYQRGGELMRVSLIKARQSNGDEILIPALKEITRSMLMRALGRTATWWTPSKELDLLRIDPPGDLGDHILGMLGEWPFPTLRGVIATPTMRFDGTLLTEPGYDPATGLVLFNPPPMPDIPAHPTQRDALDALALLNDLLAEFDFAEDENVSRAGAISMLMTPVLRGMMPAAPIHFITKPDAGSGGSYLQDLMAAIATGERCPTISLTVDNDEENEKRLSATARTGQPIVAIDNFTGTLMGNFFCQMIERPNPQIRILGKSEMVRIPNTHVVVANGINITIGTDAIRRGVRIELDPNVEHPAERIFTRDPVAEVLAHRGPAVAAILTIARAYRLAGMPGKLPPRPSFEVWSDNVRSVLVWLGWPDVDDSIKTARTADPHTSKLFAVISAWATDLTVGLGYRASELVKEASATVYPGDGSGGQLSKPDLRDALFAVAGTANGQLDAARLGNWLRDHQNRIAAGHKLVKDDADKQRLKWKLERH